MVILRVVWVWVRLVWYRRAQAGLSDRPSDPDYAYVCLRVMALQRQMDRWIEHGTL